MNIVIKLILVASICPIGWGCILCWLRWSPSQALWTRVTPIFRIPMLYDFTNYFASSVVLIAYICQICGGIREGGWRQPADGMTRGFDVRMFFISHKSWWLCFEKEVG